MLKILFAPLQGYTTGIYRKAHAELIGGVDAYYAPFLRIENGAPRAKDLRDLETDRASANKSATPLAKTVPQIIANSVTEFKTLAKALQSAGFQEIDFNMGCPFPMQVNHHRGAGLLSDSETIKAIMEEIANSSAKFSVKMRLGQNTPEEAFAILPILNEAPLAHITLHPRLGKQQYKGALDFNSFERFHNECRHPLYFNGDITSIEQMNEQERKFPKLAGVMIGRGLLANPFLAKDYKASKEPAGTKAPNGISTQSESDRMSLILKMHSALMGYACSTYQGDSQILSHLQSFWEYQEASLPKKIFKKMMKAGKLEEYRAAVDMLAQGAT